MLSTNTEMWNSLYNKKAEEEPYEDEEIEWVEPGSAAFRALIADAVEHGGLLLEEDA